MFIRDFHNRAIFFVLQIVDRDKDKNMVKIHYVGYSGDCDEWKSCEDFNVGRMEARFQPGCSSCSDRASVFFARLRRKIKFSLFSSKREDPDVRIEEPIDMDIYDEFLKSPGEAKIIRGRVVNSITANLFLMICFRHGGLKGF